MEKPLTPGEAAKLLGVTMKTLSNWRGKRIGPRYVQAGGTIRYRPEAIDAWLVKHEVKTLEG